MSYYSFCQTETRRRKEKRKGIIVFIALFIALAVAGECDRRDHEPAQVKIDFRQELLKRPALTLAMCRVEGEQNPYVRSGDGGKSHGSMQIQRKHWGKTPKDLPGQLKHGELVLDELLTETGSTEKALAAYNGATGKRAKTYVAKVRQQALEIALLEDM